MSKPTLVIAIEEEGYLFPLEISLAQRLYEKAEIEAISDRAYFEEYFTAPRNIDTLIIDESFYTPELRRHNIRKTFLLTEEIEMDDSDAEADQDSADGQQLIRIFKYMDLKVLISSVISAEWAIESQNKQQVQVVAVVSAEGGAGCTTISLGTAACLKQSLKRVLYLNTQAYQNFHFMMQKKTTLTMQSCTKLRRPDAKIYNDLKPELIRELFTYLPPLPSSRYSLGIGGKAYIDFIQTAKQSGDYDAIVVDVGSEITDDLIPLLNVANKIMVVCGQDKYAAFKLSVLLHNINYSDKERFFFICNRHDPCRSNEYMNTNMVKIDEYVKEIPEENRNSILPLTKVGEMQKIAYALM